jgi:predicted ferric reductase
MMRSLVILLNLLLLISSLVLKNQVEDYQLNAFSWLYVAFAILGILNLLNYWNREKKLNY